MTDREDLNAGTPHGLSGIAYSQSRNAHIIGTAEVWTDPYLNERQPALCGASFPTEGGFHSVSGIMLTDELRRGYLCDRCLSNLLADDVTIPGFIVDGELVGEAANLIEVNNVG